MLLLSIIATTGLVAMSTALAFGKGCPAMSISVTDPDGTQWVADNRGELVTYLNRVASQDYAARVLRWYDASTGIPFAIANGSDIETWQVGSKPQRPDVPASAFKGKRQG